MGAAAKVEPPIDIERFGALQADLAAGVPRQDALAEARLSDDQLAQATDHWLGEMGREVRRGRSALSQRYAKAYVARRPELLRDPDEEHEQRLLAITKPAALPASSLEPSPTPEAEAAPAARYVPSFMLEAQPPAAPSSVAPVPHATAPLAPIEPAPSVRRPIPAHLSDTAPLQAQSHPVTPFAGASSGPVAPPAHAKKVFRTMMAMDVPASFKAMPFSAGEGDQKLPAAAAAPPAASAPASAATPATPAPPAPSSSTAKPRAPLSGTAMAFDVPASFKAVPFSSDAPPLSARAPVPSSTTAPPTSAPPESLPFEPAASRPAQPASSNQAPSNQAPSKQAPSKQAPSLSGTAMALDIPASFKAVPFTSAPARPAPPAPPPPTGIHAHTPVSGAPPLQRPPSSPAIAVVPALPPLEHYVRMGVDLATTPPAQVDAVLARAQWTRAAWDHIDRTYRDRIARDPALRQEFQTAVARERAKRGGPR